MGAGWRRIVENASEKTRLHTHHLEIHARPETEADDRRELERVVEVVVKPIVRRKLHVPLQPFDPSERNHDAFDLVGDVRITLLAELNRSEEDEGAIRDLASYAATVTSNACYQYFRARFPERTRLRNKLRYLLTHERDFALWKNTSDQWQCGLAGWESVDEFVVPAQTDRVGRTERELLAGEIHAFIAKAARPVEFDELIAHVAAVQGITEPFEVTDDDCSTTRDPAPLIDATLEQTSRLAALWCAVGELPPQHRKALLLNLRDSSGDNLLAALPMSGVATLRQIAATLDMSIDELADIWNSLPWDDLRIAEHLGLARQQVINLRQTARAKLLRWKKETGNI